MPNYTCAVADCTSARKNDPAVKGWCVFPRKKDAARRRLWEYKCKRGPKWKATKYHAICSKHFINWCNGPSPSHPDPELFGYNQWKTSKGSEASVGKRRAQPNARVTDAEANVTPSPPAPTVPTTAPVIDYMDVEQEVQTDIVVEIENVTQEQASITGMFILITLFD